MRWVVMMEVGIHVDGLKYVSGCFKVSVNAVVRLGGARSSATWSSSVSAL